MKDVVRIDDDGVVKEVKGRAVKLLNDGMEGRESGEERCCAATATPCRSGWGCSRLSRLWRLCILKGRSRWVH